MADEFTKAALYGIKTFNKKVKEKIGMEKLVELLNEYVGKHNKSDLYYKFELENGELYCYNDVSDVLWTMQDEAMVICSKKFGFIKWLVENEKIDLHGPKYLTAYYNTTDTVIMLLAISSTPIEDLISILK